MISSACALQAFIRPTHLKGSDAFNSSVAPALFASSGIISSILLELRRRSPHNAYAASRWRQGRYRDQSGIAPDMPCVKGAVV